MIAMVSCFFGRSISNQQKHFLVEIKVAFIFIRKLLVYFSWSLRSIYGWWNEEGIFVWKREPLVVPLGVWSALRCGELCQWLEKIVRWNCSDKSAQNLHNDNYWLWNQTAIRYVRDKLFDLARCQKQLSSLFTLEMFFMKILFVSSSDHFNGQRV